MAAEWESPGDGWESARRRALAEEGLRHMDRMRAAVLEHVRARRAVEQLIADAGGDPDAVPPGDRADGDDDGEWRTEAGRWIRRSRRIFEAVAEDGCAPLPAERKATLVAAGAPPGRLSPWPPTPALEARVAEAGRWADVAEDATP